jgi:hypothetical protein
MVFLVLSARGFDAIRELVKPGCELWLNAGVAPEAEVESLRGRGIGVTTFSHPLVSDAEGLAYARTTIAEHHPDEVLWVESSSDMS